MQRIIDQLAAMAEMPEMANHMEVLNTLLGVSQDVLSQIGAHDEEVGSMQSRHERQMAELVAQAEQAEANWRTELEARGEKLTRYESQIAVATEKYKAAILAANPDVPAELVSGYSIDELDQSMQRAIGIVGQIRQRVSGEKIPAGAPARGSLDLSNLSALEKIRAGIAG